MSLWCLFLWWHYFHWCNMMSQFWCQFLWFSIISLWCHFLWRHYFHWCDMMSQIWCHFLWFNKMSVRYVFDFSCDVKTMLNTVMSLPLMIYDVTAVFLILSKCMLFAENAEITVKSKCFNVTGYDVMYFYLILYIYDVFQLSWFCIKIFDLFVSNVWTPEYNSVNQKKVLNDCLCDINVFDLTPTAERWNNFFESHWFSPLKPVDLSYCLWYCFIHGLLWPAWLTGLFVWLVTAFDMWKSLRWSSLYGWSDIFRLVQAVPI